MLLYSGGASHPHNRFDILVAQPILTLTTHGEQTAIAEQSEVRYSTRILSRARRATATAPKDE